jgi:hypothetical protein
MSETLEMQIADINVGGMVQMQDHRRVRFESVAKQNMIRSTQEGRPVYEKQIVLFVRHPGEKDETAVAAQEHHKYEFPRAWAAFEAGQAVDPDGTPLAVLFPADPHIVAHLRAIHIFTVEMLAGVGEEGMRRIGMGARDYHNRAVKFLEQAEKAAPMHRVEAALKERDDEIASLKAQMQMLADNAVRRARRKPEEGDPE